MSLSIAICPPIPITKSCSCPDIELPLTFILATGTISVSASHAFFTWSKYLSESLAIAFFQLPLLFHQNLVMIPLKTPQQYHKNFAHFYLQLFLKFPHPHKKPGQFGVLAGGQVAVVRAFDEKKGLTPCRIEVSP